MEVEMAEKEEEQGNKMEMQATKKTQDDNLFTKAVGSFGCWQKIIFLIFFFSNFLEQCQNFVMTFLAPNTAYRCVQWSSNQTDLHSNNSNQCYREIILFSKDDRKKTEKVQCIKWMFDETEDTESFISKFDLVCEREWLISFSKSVYMAGFMVSVFITGQISDRMGRRVVIITGYILGCVSLASSLFVNSMTSFLILRFLHALGHTGSSAAGMVLVMEIVGVEHRTSTGILIQLSWPLGTVYLVLVAYFVKNWFWLQLAILLPMLLLLLFYGIIPESPRYLVMHQRKKELQEMIETAAKRNGAKCPGEGLSDLIIEAFHKDKSKEISGSLLDVFKNTRMRRRILNLIYCWLVSYFIYYGISYNTNDLAGNPYINFAIAGCLEIPGFLISYFSAKKFGRKWSLAVLTLSCCIPTGILIFWQGHAAATTSLSMIAILCIISSSGLTYLYTGELFPTIVRNSALGVCDTAARVGSILSPFVRDLAITTSDYVPFTIYFSLALTSGVLVFWLPETAGTNLADTLDEGSNLESKTEQKTKEKLNASGLIKTLCCQC